KVLITGGAGYVGSELATLLAIDSTEVVIYDTFWFSTPDIFKNYQNIQTIIGDIRDQQSFKSALGGITDVIHLACISNDPSFDLLPDLSKEINYNCFEELVLNCKQSGVKRFIHASSSSVYGIKPDCLVTEEMSTSPLTLYSKYKGLCEEILNTHSTENFTTVNIRPATVCGVSKRQRLDVIVNILTNHAFHNQKIKIFGGNQKRPNIHIKDMCRLYSHRFDVPVDKINGKTFNAGEKNYTVNEIANRIQSIIPTASIETIKSNDDRSYHICSNRLMQELEFSFKYTIDDAIKDLINSFEEKIFIDPLNNSQYFNVKHINQLEIT
ncbi:MAG: SDR family oxidoreductase, partial [Halobacteriovoraceae bacterium]|nr:SDR family oxidoreductase [Halobacteriovoraceae bacterium]